MYQGPIIDFRLRPPLDPFTRMVVYNNVAQYEAKIKETPDPAGVKRDMNLLFQEMKELNIVHGVFGGRMHPVVEACTDNDGIAKIVKDYPGKFTGFAGIDHRDMKKAIAETERSLKKLGLKGINMDLGYFQDPPTNYDDAKMYPYYEFLQANKIPMMATMSGLVGANITTAHPLPIDNVARDFPNLTIMIMHGCWPYVQEICAIAFKRGNVYLAADYYGYGFPGHMFYVEAANTYLEDRVLFATAFPMRNMKIMIETHKSLPFKPEVAEKYFYRNAKNLLGLQ